MRGSGDATPMFRPRARTLLDGALAALAIVFVVAVAYLPHADSAANPASQGQPPLVELAQTYWDSLTGSRSDYPYTVHVDENMHWSRMADVERHETLRFDGLYTSGLPGADGSVELRPLVHETGFFVALVHFQELTGIEWIVLIRFLPALWAGATAFLVWAALRPWRGAPLAAAFVGLIPTSARFLGPGLLVPIGFGMAWIAAALMLLPAVQRRRAGAGALLLLVTVWAFFIHLIAGFAVLLLLLASLPLQGRNLRSFMLLTLTSAVPLLVLLNVFTAGVAWEINRVGNLPVDLTIFDQVATPFLVIWAIGCAAAFLPAARDAPTLILRATTLASLTAFGFLAASTALHGAHYALYDRWHQPFVLFATVPAAHGLVWTARGAAALARRSWGYTRATPFPRRASTAIVTVLLLAGALTAASAGTAGHLREPYYHIVSDHDWGAFQWAADHVNETYDVYLMDPWKAPVFHAMTGKTPLTYLDPGSPPIRGADWASYLEQASGPNATPDGAWLVARNVSIVFDSHSVPTGFERTSPDTVQLAWPQAQTLAQVRNTTAGR